MSDDEDLQKAVLAELNWEPSVNPAHIGVVADRGVVTLSGHAESFFEKYEIELAARRVKGVKAIVTEIEVKLPMDIKRSDEEIAAAAIDRLGWDVSVPKDAIKITVDQGWLTLTGQVDWRYQKKAAEVDVQRLFGVIGLSNQITIKTRVNTSFLSDEITHAIHRSWFFDPETINVNADGGKVHLTGTATSQHDRRVAAITVWTAPGVIEVTNDIIVI